MYNVLQNTVQSAKHNFKFLYSSEGTRNQALVIIENTYNNKNKNKLQPFSSKKFSHCTWAGAMRKQQQRTFDAGSKKIQNWLILSKTIASVFLLCVGERKMSWLQNFLIYICIYIINFFSLYSKIISDMSNCPRGDYLFLNRWSIHLSMAT